MLETPVRPLDLLIGTLFHLDVGFRSGTVNMVREAVRNSDNPMVLIPAVQVGALGLRQLN